MMFFNKGNSDYSLGQLQERISELFALLAGIFMIVHGLIDYFLGQNLFYVQAKLVFALICLGGYFLMRKKGYYQLGISAQLVFGVVFIAFNYLNGEGFRGPTVYTAFIFTVIISILIKGKARVVWISLVLALYFLLFFLEINGTISVVSRYNTVEILFWDHFVTIILCVFFIFSGISVFIRGYTSQNKLLENLREDNEKKLLELSDVNIKKNQLIALLSHDLKSPIGTLSSTLELIDRDKLEKENIEEIFNSLKSQSFHLNKVLNNTLNWVMVELTGGNENREEVSIYHITDELKDIMQVQAGRKGQEISCTKQGGDKLVEIEVNEITIVLKNLLDNAIKFSPTGARIDLRLEVKQDEIRWEVKNEGIGIPYHLHQELFDFKVKSTYGTQREKGTGLGLPLCKKIAEKLNMSLGFESNGGEKNTFYLVKKLS